MPGLISLPRPSRKSDLLWVLWLTPLWWISGFNFFVYQLSACLIFIKLMMACIKNRTSIALPRGIAILVFFIVSYLVSILLNVSEQSDQRLWAAGNNWSMFVMGLLLTIIVYNDVSPHFFSDLFMIGKSLCLISATLTLICITLWATGYRSLETVSLAGRIFPRLLEFPFFYLLLTLRFTGSDWLVQTLPRVSLYSHAYITTGDFMVMVLPLLLGQLGQKKFHWGHFLILIYSGLPLVFSLSRSALCAFAGSLIFVQVLNKNKNLWVSLLWFLAGMGILYFLYSGVEWILNLRIESTVGRFGLYENAIRNVLEINPLLGLGVRLREGFTMMAVGSHSTYIGILLATGFIGLGLFLGFQLWIFVIWFESRRYVTDPSKVVIWKSLGMSFMGANAVFLTSNMDAVPLIVFIYFVIVGSILLLGRMAKNSAWGIAVK